MGRVKIEFDVVSDLGEPQLLDAFYQIKKKVITCLNLESTGNYSTHADFNRDFPRFKNTITLAKNNIFDPVKTIW